MWLQTWIETFPVREHVWSTARIRRVELVSSPNSFGLIDDQELAEKSLLNGVLYVYTHILCIYEGLIQRHHRTHYFTNRIVHPTNNIKRAYTNGRVNEAQLNSNWCCLAQPRPTEWWFWSIFNEYVCFLSFDSRWTMYCIHVIARRWVSETI